MRVAWIGLLMVGLLMGCGGHGAESPLAPTAIETGSPASDSSATVVDEGSGSVSGSAASSSTLPQITGVIAAQWDWAKAPKYRGFFYADLNDLGATWDWVITGSNFGPMRGQVVVSPGAFKAWPDSWSDRQIRVRVQSFMASVPQAAAGITIVLQNGRMAAATVKLVPSIQTRVYGQCTWHAAKRRLESNLSIPMPMAYSTRGPVDATYVPASRDVLMFTKVEHTVFVESATRMVVADDRGGNRTIRYSLLISQYNARYDEAYSTYSTTHEVREQYDTRTGAVRSRALVSAPKFNGYSADGYWR